MFVDQMLCLKTVAMQVSYGSLYYKALINYPLNYMSLFMKVNANVN